MKRTPKSYRPRPNEVSQLELSKLTGVTTRQLFNLRRGGMPHRTERRDVFYPVPAALEWYYAKKFKRDESAEAREQVKRAESERRKAAAEAEIKEMQRDQLRGTLILDEDAAAEYQEFCDRVMAALRAAPSRHAAKILNLATIPAAIAGLQDIMEHVIEDSRSAVTALSDEHVEVAA